MNDTIGDVAPIIEQSGELLKKIEQEVSKVIVGNQETIDFILIALLAHGHILVEGAPGIAKTTLIKTVSQTLDVDFKRIQFTPDLLPSDLIGASIYNPKTHEFETKKGPLFAHFVLADEINRAPAKVQAALLEAMQEHQVTIGTQTFKLDEPFFVFATQNPLEQQGTYELPEAQVDRFMFKLVMTYPSMESERQIIARKSQPVTVLPIINKEQLLKMQELTKSIYVNERVIDYIVRIIDATRNPEHHGLAPLKQYVLYGSSPRGTLSIFAGAQAHALLKKRSFVTPDDIKAVALPALRHRIMLNFQAEADNVTTEIFIRKILATLPTP